MKIPKAIIPVHTCEPDGHQSISHTSQQNRVPREPANLLCNALNGCIYREGRFQKGAQKGDVEPGAGEPGSFLPGHRKEKLVYVVALPRASGAFKTPWPQPRKAFVRFSISGQPQRTPTPGGATGNPEPDPGVGTRRAPRPTDTGDSVIVCETSVRFGGGRCIKVEYCHLPNCSKPASSPPPLVIMAGAGLLPGNQAESWWMNPLVGENLGSCLLSYYPRGPAINLPSF